MSRIGVFICWCGENIARTVDVDEVAKQVAGLPGVRCSVNYKYMCSDPGQAMVREKIASEKLDGVVVASCSPHMHLKTFRKAAQAAGLNPYLVEMANIREHCSWVHHDRSAGYGQGGRTSSACRWRRCGNDHALEPIRVPVTRRALVIGGGVAGIQAALDIADAGYEVVMVEREPSIGGKMAGLVGDFPHPRLLAVHSDAAHGGGGPASAHQALHVFGSRSRRRLRRQLQVKIRQKARYVDISKCTGCGECWNVCPLKRNPSEFDFGMGMRPAIYIPFPQAVPARPVIDKKVCAKLIRNGCGLCEKKCKAGAINFKDEDKLVEEKVGASRRGHRLQALQHRQGAGRKPR